MCTQAYLTHLLYQNTSSDLCSQCNSLVLRKQGKFILKHLKVTDYTFYTLFVSVEFIFLTGNDKMSCFGICSLQRQNSGVLFSLSIVDQHSTSVHWETHHWIHLKHQNSIILCSQNADCISGSSPFFSTNNTTTLLFKNRCKVKLEIDYWLFGGYLCLSLSVICKANKLMYLWLLYEEW